MNSLQTSIYEHEEVLYTLAWLSESNIESNSKKIIRRAIRHRLVNVHNDRCWQANERKILRRLNYPKITLPHHSKIKDLTKILIGFGEISARSHGDFISMASKRFKTHFYKRALSRIIKEALKTQNFLKRKRTLEEIGYSQKIGKTNFDWNGYEGVLNELNYGSRISTYNYGLAFIVKLCLKVIPCQFSMIVEKCKATPVVGDLCHPIIEPLMFRYQQYIVPLLKSKNAYLRLLACASVVQQELFENQSPIDENIKILVANGIDVGDVIWISSVKLRDHYQSVERIKGQIVSTRHEILFCEKSPSLCPKGIEPEKWIGSRKGVLSNCEESLINAEDKLKTSFNGLKEHWPTSSLAPQQIDNLVHLIKNEKLSRQLAELISSKDNRIQILDYALSSVMRWIGISSQPILDVCEETFLYSSKRDLERLVNAAKTILLLSNIKGKTIGKFLGSRVEDTVASLEKFSCCPYMDVRKPNQWQSATSRLACIHLLAMCVFDETPEDQEGQVSTIGPMVVDKVNLLLKVQGAPFHLGADELFKDLKRITTHVISSKNYMTVSVENIVFDSDLPSDYRARVIVANEILLGGHSGLLLELFEEFGEPPIYIDGDYKHFSEWICLLDICIAHCWKFKADQVAQEIIRVWRQYCPLYGDKCSDFVEYALKLYRALSKDGKDRVWLKELNGFEQSNCMKFLNESLAQSD
jgi:hypothetical protein